MCNKISWSLIRIRDLKVQFFFLIQVSYSPLSSSQRINSWETEACFYFSFLFWSSFIESRLQILQFHLDIMEPTDEMLPVPGRGRQAESKLLGEH